MSVPSPSSMPVRRAPLAPVVVSEQDPQLSIHHWNHTCPYPACGTWVPNHRRACVAHEEKQ